MFIANYKDLYHRTKENREDFNKIIIDKVSLGATEGETKKINANVVKDMTRNLIDYYDNYIQLFKNRKYVNEIRYFDREDDSEQPKNFTIYSNLAKSSKMSVKDLIESLEFENYKEEDNPFLYDHLINGEDFRPIYLYIDSSILDKDEEFAKFTNILREIIAQGRAPRLILDSDKTTIKYMYIEGGKFDSPYIYSVNQVKKINELNDILVSQKYPAELRFNEYSAYTGEELNLINVVSASDKTNIIEKEWEEYKIDAKNFVSSMYTKYHANISQFMDDIRKNQATINVNSRNNKIILNYLVAGNDIESFKDWSDLENYLILRRSRDLSIMVKNYKYAWTYSDVARANSEIENLANDINSKNLSPFEKILYIHKYITLNFSYTSSKSKLLSDTEKVRTPITAIKDREITCTGFVTLFNAIIEKLNDPNLSCKIINAHGFTLDRHHRDKDKNYKMTAAHSLCAVQICDPKYNINGEYIEDVTNDCMLKDYDFGRGFASCLRTSESFNDYSDKRIYRLGNLESDTVYAVKPNTSTLEEILANNSRFCNGQKIPEKTFIKGIIAIAPYFENQFGGKMRSKDEFGGPFVNENILNSIYNAKFVGGNFKDFNFKKFIKEWQRDGKD